MRTYRRYTKEQVEQAVKNSKSWKEAIKFLNPDNSGYRGSESNLKKTAVKFCITFNHFPGRRWSVGKVLKSQRPIEEYFRGAFIKSNELKKRLFKEGLKHKQCELCQNINWLDQPIALELHHKNKNPNDNSFENLEILCSNCHSYRHKQIPKEKIVRLSSKKKEKKNKCIRCQQPAINKFCSYNCANLSARKVDRPSKEVLTELVWQKSCSQIAREYKVTDNAISKWCKQYKISKPSRGYWVKHTSVVQEQETQPLEG